MDREIVKEESMYDFYREQTLLLTDENKKLKKEIERLNNIINELEKILEEERKKDRPRDDYNYGVGNTLDYIWCKSQELKGSE